MATNKEGRYPALKSADFRYFWAGQFISNVGTQMQIVAVNWQIYILTGSAAALGIIGLSRFLPIAIFSLIGGSFADVHNRKTIQLVTQSVMALLSGILMLATFFHFATSAVIYLVTILMSVALSFDLPARQALVPNLVDRKHLQNAMSLNFIMFQTAIIAGPAIGGFLIGAAGVGPIYLINAFSFVAVIISLFLIKTSGEPDVIQGKKTEISAKAVIEGLKFVRSKTIIWSTMLLDFFSTLFASATVILPIFAVNVLHVGPVGLGFLYAAPAIGAVIGGFVMAHVGRIKHEGIVLLIAVAIFGVATILFGISKNLYFSLFVLAIVGAGDSVSTVIRNVIRQLETPDFIRGRITSINMIFFAGGPQLGEFEAGILASLVGGPLSVVIGGIGTLIVVGATSILIPQVRKYNNPEA